MQFSQSIRQIMTNFFLENHTQNAAEKEFLDPFLKN